MEGVGFNDVEVGQTRHRPLALIRGRKGAWRWLKQNVEQNRELKGDVLGSVEVGQLSISQIEW